jgi:hypothetical protein
MTKVKKLRVAEPTPRVSLWPKDLFICPKCKKNMIHHPHRYDMSSGLVCPPDDGACKEKP